MQVYSRLGVELDEVGESFYNEYIPPVIAHLAEIGVVTVSDGAKVSARPRAYFCSFVDLETHPCNHMRMAQRGKAFLWAPLSSFSS